MPHAIFIPFLFALGSCVGSFLNVVVWRLPRIEHDENDRSILGPLLKTMQGLSYPPSHCPKCNTPLKWYDNLPVVGWLKLGGKCRYCKEPISMRYPIIEAVTGLLFVFYYVMFFILQIGPCAAHPTLVNDPLLGSLRMGPRLLDLRLDWAIYLLYMALISGLLASSLIDAELFIIPVEIPWVLAAVGVIVHTIIDKPTLPGALNANAGAAALGLGGAVGLIISIALWSRGLIAHSFPEGEPMQDIEPEPGEPPPQVWTRRMLITEMRKEMMFLLPPMLLAAGWWFAATRVAPVASWWNSMMQQAWFSGQCGAMLGALVGGFVVWITRILGTLAFGRLAMGLGDVHLMFGVGAIIGAGASTVAFFLAPFFGILIAIYLLLTGTRREIPYGPYLSLATAAVLLFACPILAYLTPGMMGLSMMLHDLIQ
jgi:leader peptidase (prepilin peptidase)/N-methyltransferase